MIFSKNYLNSVYEWTPENKKSIFTGGPSRRPFNRLNGDQVLFIINYFLNSFEYWSVDDGKRIEQLIIDKLPFSTSSEITVFHWLQEKMVKVY